MHLVFGRIGVFVCYGSVLPVAAACVIGRLVDWAAKRPTRIKINGTLTQEYPMVKGMPHG